jgi:hypothetical protein
MRIPRRFDHLKSKMDSLIRMRRIPAFFLEDFFEDLEDIVAS